MTTAVILSCLLSFKLSTFSLALPDSHIRSSIPIEEIVSKRKKRTKGKKKKKRKKRTKTRHDIHNDREQREDLKDCRDAQKAAGQARNQALIRNADCQNAAALIKDYNAQLAAYAACQDQYEADLAAIPDVDCTDEKKSRR